MTLIGIDRPLPTIGPPDYGDSAATQRMWSLSALLVTVGAAIASVAAMFGTVASSGTLAGWGGRRLIGAGRLLSHHDGTYPPAWKVALVATLPLWVVLPTVVSGLAWRSARFAAIVVSSGFVYAILRGLRDVGVGRGGGSAAVIVVVAFVVSTVLSVARSSRQRRHRGRLLALMPLLVAIGAGLVHLALPTERAGSSQPQDAARRMLQAALVQDRYEALLVLDPVTIDAAGGVGGLVRGGGSTFEKLGSVVRFLGASTPNEVQMGTPTVTGSTAVVPILPMGDSLKARLLRKAAGGVAAVITSKTGVTLPGIVVVQRGGRWYVDPAASEATLRAGLGLGALGQGGS